MESDVKSIILRNDSILEYWKRYGGIGSSMIIKYALIDNELIVNYNILIIPTNCHI